MMDKANIDQTDTHQKPKHENKFVKEQPLRHSLAVVGQDGDQVKINKQLYQILVNKRDALDIEMLRQKYDPYLDQYDFLVGDVSSEHLRLKGFYKDNMRTAIDRKEQTIADYLMEYCNPGTGYFILQLLNPVHHYHTSAKKARYGNRYQRNQHLDSHSKKAVAFKRRRVHKTTIKKKETIAVKKEYSNHHSFVIKKRKDSN